MAYKNRYFKNPVGTNNNFSFIGICGQSEYSDSTTLTLFLTESVPGEVGVFNAASGALISGAGAVSTTLPIVIAVNNGKDVKVSEPFTVAAAKITRSPYVAPVKGATAFDFDDAAAAPAKGDEFGVKVIDLTIGGNPTSTFDFNYVCKTGDTFDTAIAALVAIINDTAGVLLKDRDQLVTAAYNSTTNVLTITNVDNYVITKVLLQGKLAEYTNTATVTKTVQGHGDVVDAKLWEEAMFIRDGVTTNYPSTPMTQAESFGRPDSLIVSGGQYNHYTFQLVKSDTAKTVKKIDEYPTTMELVVASNGAANAEAEIKAIFGL